MPWCDGLSSLPHWATSSAYAEADSLTVYEMHQASLSNTSPVHKDEEQGEREPIPARGAGGVQRQGQGASLGMSPTLRHPPGLCGDGQRGAGRSRGAAGRTPTLC